MERYDIFSDTMQPVSPSLVMEMHEVHRTYGQIRALVNYYDQQTQLWEPEDKLRSFISELNRLHEDLKVRLEAGRP